ncbi:MAG TPA: hypothetical protein VNJ11_01090 [Bryobacteraceae bacterium]|nr:hypothetical protein [Bryobacteraceae bacterium]
MIDHNTKVWLTEAETSQLTGLSRITLRVWRHQERKDGRRRGGLVWRAFGTAIRYWAPSVLEPDLGNSATGGNGGAE